MLVRVGTAGTQPGKSYLLLMFVLFATASPAGNGKRVFVAEVMQKRASCYYLIKGPLLY